MENLTVKLPTSLYNAINDNNDTNYYLGIHKERWFLFYSRIFLSNIKTLGKFDLGTRVNYRFIRMVLGGNTKVYTNEYKKFIDINRSYHVGKRSMTYKFKFDYLVSDDLTQVEITDDILIKRIKRGYQSEWREIIDNLNYDINNRIDGDTDEINDLLKNSTIKVDKNLRTYSLFTSSKDIRSKVSVDGERFVQLDISASHLSILPNVLPQELRKNKDVIKFKDLISYGDVYTFFQKEVNKLISTSNSSLSQFDFDIEGRKRFKTYILMYLNSKVSKYFWLIERVFEKHFPTIYKFISGLKSINNAFISNVLMQEESYLLYKFYHQQKISDKSLVLIPIHDAIMVKKSKAIELQKKMSTFYRKELGYYINIKIK